MPESLLPSPGSAPEPGSASRWQRLRRGRRGDAGEHLYRMRRVRGATLFTSRQQHQDLTVVVERFPSRRGIDETDAPTFLLVHGLGVSSRFYEPLAAELATTGRVFLVDLAGYGAAPDPRRDVTIADHAATLGGVMATLAERWPAAGPPVVVGHSMGSQVVASLAAQHPEIANRIVLIAPTIAPDLRAYRPAALTLLRDAPREPLRVLWVAGTEYLIRCGLPYMIRQAPHMFSEEVLEERLPQLQASVLIVCGDDDPVVPVWYGRELARLLPHAEFLEVRGAHAVFYTDPERIAATITAFALRPPH